MRKENDMLKRRSHNKITTCVYKSVKKRLLIKFGHFEYKCIITLKEK